MYKQFFQLRENPFNVTPDSNFFFPSSTHAEAFAHLTFGIEQRKGIIVITGKIGTGKTTLCRAVMRQMNKRTKTALILNPKFSDTQLLQVMLDDLGVPGTFQSKFELVKALNLFLLTETQKGNNVVIIIDEAQNLKASQLENIRLLSNIETEKEKLLQIILVGQPELQRKLKLPSLKQLNQRIIVRYNIRPLTYRELCDYIRHRLKLASLQHPSEIPEIFTKTALDAIYEHSQGTPRLINIICDHAMLAGFVKGLHTIHDTLIYECMKELCLT